MLTNIPGWLGDIPNIEYKMLLVQQSTAATSGLSWYLIGSALIICFLFYYCESPLSGDGTD